MNQLVPSVRYMILCEQVLTDPANPKRVSIIGLMSAIRSLDSSPYPLRYREFTVFLQLAECRGAGTVRVEIQHADTGDVIFQTKERILNMGNDPLELLGITFKINDCLFPQSGLYWVQLWYNDGVLTQQPLILR
jgi:hypothetical protein